MLVSVYFTERPESRLYRNKKAMLIYRYNKFSVRIR